MKPDNHIQIPKKKLGVLMVNLGTPEKTDFINMWKYLREFLSDRRIIELTRLIWYPILYGIILMVRPGKSGKLYKSIWDKKNDESPLKVFTRNVSAKLQKKFSVRFTGYQKNIFTRDIHITVTVQKLSDYLMKNLRKKKSY